MKLDRSKKEEIRKAVKFFEDVCMERFEGFDLRKGLCYNFKYRQGLANYLYKWLLKFNIDWTLWEGNIEYSELFPCGYFPADIKLYEGKELEKRKALSLWIIKELEKVLEESEEVNITMEELDFKVGDWVTSKTHDNLTVKIKKFTKFVRFDSSDGNTLGLGHLGWTLDCFRKATPQEILKAKGIKEGDWVYCDQLDDPTDFEFVYKITCPESVGLNQAKAMRLATEEEILNEIAKFEVGEVVWSIANNQFVKITHMQLSYDKTQAEYATNGEVFCWCYEKELEKRPPQKFKVGDRVNHKHAARTYVVTNIDWHDAHACWVYRNKVKDGYDLESSLYLFEEPKREPEAGDVWTCLGCKYLITKDGYMGLTAFEPVVCDKKDYKMDEYLGKFHEVFQQIR